MGIIMARAKPDFTAIRAIPLSQLFADPFLREVFRRAEDDTGTALTVAFADPPDRPRLLQGGAAERVRELEFA
jgi:hypothetical protein